MTPTYAALELELNQTKAELNQARELLRKTLEEISKLSDEITKLKEQIARNSKNSSKPPSSDQKGNSTDPKQPKKEQKKRKGKARTSFPLTLIQFFKFHIIDLFYRIFFVVDQFFSEKSEFLFGIFELRIIFHSQ